MYYIVHRKAHSVALQDNRLIIGLLSTLQYYLPYVYNPILIKSIKETRINLFTLIYYHIWMIYFLTRMALSEDVREWLTVNLCRLRFVGAGGQRSLTDEILDDLA
jgi:hypothetical protein